MKKYRFIVVERQYASGGRQIGALLAEQLGIPCHNEEILETASQRLGISLDYAREIEESAASSLMLGLSLAAGAAGDQENLPLTERLAHEESNVIAGLAKQGPCIFIGRCAGQVLGDRQDILRVFLYASEEERVRRATQEYGLPKENILSVLRKNDRRRANFYHAHAGGARWDGRETYALSLNTGELGQEICARLIAEAYRGE